MKNNTFVIANTLAVTTGIFFVACRLLVGLFPDLMFSIAQSWFHDIVLTKATTLDLTIETLVLGLVSSMGTSWIVGFLFSTVYGHLNKR